MQAYTSSAVAASVVISSVVCPGVAMSRTGGVSVKSPGEDSRGQIIAGAPDRGGSTIRFISSSSLELVSELGEECMLAGKGPRGNKISGHVMCGKRP
jgi:hypothetical protein